MCRPEIELSSIPFIEIRAGRHPCIVQTYTGDDFIPNDVIVNGEGVASGRTCVVVTGPNMGGKSTLLRQTGLILILAQLVSESWFITVVPSPIQLPLFQYLHSIPVGNLKLG